MRSEDRESPVAFAPRAVARTSQPWIEAAAAALDWYGAMLRLAFGLERVKGSPGAEHPVTAPSASPIPAPELPAVAAPGPVSTPPLEARPQHQSHHRASTTRSRSRKASGVKRHRRAA